MLRCTLYCNSCTWTLDGFVHHLLKTAWKRAQRLSFVLQERCTSTQCPRCRAGFCRGVWLIRAGSCMRTRRSSKPDSPALEHRSGTWNASELMSVIPSDFPSDAPSWRLQSESTSDLLHRRITRQDFGIIHVSELSLWILLAKAAFIWSKIQ